MNTKKNLNDLEKIIETLRSETGCPWDREQTHGTLKPCIMEEAAEVNAAIRIYETTGAYENLREELGDVLLQVVMHSEIAKEEGIFSLEEVIDEISEKMIRRHPHVFGNKKVNNSDEVLHNWEEIKKEEKATKQRGTLPLQEIPIEFPALTRCTKVLKTVDKEYAQQKTAMQSSAVLKKLAQRLEESLQEKEENGNVSLNTAENKKGIENIMGEMLVEICNVARVKKISIEQLLVEQIEEIIGKYEP